LKTVVLTDLWVRVPRPTQDDLDFDGSFWRAIDPNGGKEPPPFFINYDKGYITLISEDEARYEASTGDESSCVASRGP
jgi:hypothetical protein